MRNPRQIALKPLSSLVSQYDFARIALHEQTGAVVSIAGRSAGVNWSANKTLLGSPANTVWTANPGYATLEGDNWFRFDDVPQLADLLTLANRPAGGVLLMASARQESNPADSTEHALLSVNGASGTAGAFTLILDNYATPHFKVVHRPVGSAVDTTSTVNATVLAAAFPVSTYLNCANPAASLIGVTSNIAAHTTINIGALNALATINPTQGATFMARDAGTPLKIMNNASVRWKLHDFWIIGFDVDPVASGKLAAIVAEYSKTPWDNLRSLST